MHIRVDSNVSDDAYSDDIELQPGPRDPTVLYLQVEHRSTNVWNVSGGDSQRSRVRCKFPALHPRMVQILRNLRFDWVARLADGNIITGCTRVEGAEGGWSKLIKEMFGSPPGRALNYGRLKLSWLDSVVPEVLVDDADDDELVRYTQAYLLQLLGGVLFTDHQGSQVHCMFIPLLQIFSHCETLSWGSGVLAYLYRELCKSCKIGVEEIAGCVLLVQLWAWTRLPTLALVPSFHPLDIWGDHKGPYGLRGDVVGGSKSLIDSIANHGRHVLEYQYSRGLFQDFPVDVRCAREETLRGKTKKVGHKGGRGGINAPKRRKLDIDNEAGDHVHEDVHLGDEDHLVEGGGQDFADFFAGGTSTYDLDEGPHVDLSAPCPHPTFDCADSEFPPPQQHRATTIVRPSPSSYVPSFRLLASNDFLTPPEQPPVEDNVEEHPELQTHRDTTIVQLSQSAYVPTFWLLASNDFITPPLVEQHDQQPSEEPRRQQQAPAEEFVQEQPPTEGIIEEQPVVEQLQAPIEEQEEVAHEAHPMKLRTLNRHPPKCGTDGVKKAPEVKQHYERIRKKQA
ncbi:hypothetical protein POM88_001135 [Heracleum sosnowskyi]|uniref:Aminotransferase-like plant mobile domain-containing protein n=1 Tax=Heracleum sosnowskyi TaxID=360622 RepID=A0AAD8JFK0_9APIA|nr:hypothetical protein POM88_001135 [Heracleum sosnowskyi]